MPRYPETGLASANVQCTNCHETPGTINVLDMDGGVFVGEQFLCATCAETAGYVHSKAAPLKISPEMLEELLGGMKTDNLYVQSQEDPAADPSPMQELFEDAVRKFKLKFGSVEFEDDDDGSDD